MEPFFDKEDWIMIFGFVLLLFIMFVIIGL